MRQKFWELGGSRMGNAVGVKEEKANDEKNDTEEAQASENADGVSYHRAATQIHIREKL